MSEARLKFTIKKGAVMFFLVTNTEPIFKDGDVVFKTYKGNPFTPKYESGIKKSRLFKKPLSAMRKAQKLRGAMNIFRFDVVASANGFKCKNLRKWARFG